MARFLSQSWLEQLAAAAVASERLREAAGRVQLSVRHVVRGGPDGDVSFSVRLGGGDVWFSADGTDDVDIEVASDYGTAASIGKGELSPAVALAAGRLTLRGRVGLLAEHQDVFNDLGDIFGPVRAGTEY